MKKQTLRGGILAVAAIVLALLSNPGISFAATSSSSTKQNTTKPQSSNDTFKVSPTRQAVTINKGQSEVIKTYIQNITKAPIDVHPIENDFVAGDESGTPAIILDENSYAPSHSLKRFMLPLEDFTVGPGERKEVDVTVTVPKSAQAGGYYGAIRFAPAQGPNGGNLSLNPSVASLILVTVPGPTVENLLLTNFDIQQDGSSGTSFRNPNDIQLVMRFQNKGNVQEAPTGQINVLKGKKVLYTNNFNQNNPKEFVLPDSARRWTVDLKKMGKFGKYTVAATFSYGAQNQTIEMKKTIWIIPTTYIYVGLGILAFVVLFLIMLIALIRSKMGGSSRGKSRRYRR